MTPAPRTIRFPFTRFAAACLACALFASPAAAQYIRDEVPDQAKGLTLENRLGESVPMDIELIAISGETVMLAESFEPDKPVLLTMAYFDCPVLCPAMMSQLAQAFNSLDYTAGEDFNLVVVSFDHTNTSTQALQYREELLGYYESDASQEILRDGLQFFTADETNARRLADALGFSYRYLPDIDEYSHTSGLYVLTPEGAVSHLFPNYTFRDPGAADETRDLKLSMLKATQGGIADSIADVILNFCYSYNPNRGTYTIAAMRLMRTVAILTALVLASLIVALRFREARRRRESTTEDSSKTIVPGPIRPVAR